MVDFEQLLNTVQRHTKCSQYTFLRRKGHQLQSRYKAPWNTQPSSTLVIDSE